MKKFSFGILIMMLCCFIVSSCSGSKSRENFPSDFEKYSDTQKVEYMMKQTTPDSVARFICNAAIDRIPGVTIDSLGAATLYAYEKYHGKDLDTFQIEFDRFSISLPLAPRMKLMFKAGMEDPIQLGYQLGLEYVSQIRTQHKKVSDIEAEIKEFRKACGSDIETYNRFIKGFKIALEADHGKDLSEDVYRHFINYNYEKVL